MALHENIQHRWPCQGQDPFSSHDARLPCRLVKDKNTQKLKGTAFVEYERLEDAQRAADACAKARSACIAALMRCW